MILERTVLFAAVLVPFSLFAQTTHHVEVGGSTLSPPDPYYLPSGITISPGDIVRWTNVSGTHNVNGSSEMFPDNPEGFYNGLPDDGPWTFDVTFTFPGIYNYHCDSEGHAATQFGTVRVLTGTGVSEVAMDEEIKIHPNPVGDMLMVEVGDLMIKGASILGLDGRLIATTPVSGQGLLRIITSDLPKGNYILVLNTASGSKHVPFTRM